METRSQTKVAMQYGLMLGVAGSLVYLIFYFMNADPGSRLPTWIGYLLMIVFITLGIKSYRDQDLAGYISYGKSLGTGVLVGLFSGIILAAFTVLMFTVIDPGLAEKVLQASEQKWIESGMGDEEISMAMKWAEKFLTPSFLFVFTLVGNVFMSVLFSLIISIFMRKESHEHKIEDLLQ